jgi:phosphocarrier protein
MINKTLIVQNKLGIHARPAGMIVETTGKSKSEVQMKYQGMSANAKSILNIMMLAVEPGAEVEFTVEGADEQKILKDLETLFHERFHEED